MYNDINALMLEYMDLSDQYTLKQMSALLEADQNQFLMSLTGKLYDKIKEKATKIDFSSISKSRGDITKIQNYDTMMECLDIMRKIVLEYKQDPEPVDMALTAVENLKNRERMFKKAFTIGTSLPILTYNTIGLAIVQSTSFLIATCVEFIKNPGSESFKMALDTVAYNRTKDHLLFKTMNEFNRSCKSGEFDQAMNLIMNQAVATREAADAELDKIARIETDHPFLTQEEIENDTVSVIHDEDRDIQQEGFRQIGHAISYTATKVLLWICRLFIPMIRSVVYLYYLQRQKMSDYYNDLANLVQMNAMEIQYNNSLTDAEKKKIYERQMKLVEKYKKRANQLDVDYSKAKAASEKIQKDEQKKMNYNDISDTVEDPYSSSIFEATINEDMVPMSFEPAFKHHSMFKEEDPEDEEDHESEDNDDECDDDECCDVQKGSKSVDSKGVVINVSTKNSTNNINITAEKPHHDHHHDD